MLPVKVLQISVLPVEALQVSVLPVEVLQVSVLLVQGWANVLFKRMQHSCVLLHSL